MALAESDQSGVVYVYRTDTGKLCSVISDPGLRLGFDIVDLTATFTANGPVNGRLFELVVRAEHSTGKAPAVITLRSLRRMPP